MKIGEIEPQFAQKLGDPLKHVLHDLNYVLPEDCKVQITLLDANRRKKASHASADNWSPESGRIEIRFERAITRQDLENAMAEAPVCWTSLSKNPRLLCFSVDNKPTTEALHKFPFDEVSRLIFKVRESKHHAYWDLIPARSPAPTQPSTIRPKVGGAATADSNPESAEAELLRTLDRAESKPGWNFVPLKKFRDEILPLEPVASTLTHVERKDALDLAIKKQLVLTSRVPNPKAPQFPVTTIRLNRLMPEVKAALGQGTDLDQEFRPIEIRGEPLSATILRERR